MFLLENIWFDLKICKFKELIKYVCVYGFYIQVSKNVLLNWSIDQYMKCSTFDGGRDSY